MVAIAAVLDGGGARCRIATVGMQRGFSGDAGWHRLQVGLGGGVVEGFALPTAVVGSSGSNTRRRPHQQSRCSCCVSVGTGDGRGGVSLR